MTALPLLSNHTDFSFAAVRSFFFFFFFLFFFPSSFSMNVLPPFGVVIVFRPSLSLSCRFRHRPAPSIVFRSCVCVRSVVPGACLLPRPCPAAPATVRQFRPVSGPSGRFFRCLAQLAMSVRSISRCLARWPCRPCCLLVACPVRPSVLSHPIVSCVFLVAFV